MPKSTRRAVIAAGLALPFVKPSGAVANTASLVSTMLMVGFAGTTPESADAQRIAREIEAGQIVGACFLGMNTRSREGMIGLTRLFNGAARRVKPLVAVDQEGGRVQRLGARIGYAAIPTAKAISQSKSPAEAEAIYAEMASILRGAGFNLNLAPVVDLGHQPANPVVTKHDRAYGKDGATVAAYAAAFVRGHRRQRVLTALKHFPGHGSTLVDSHKAPVDLTATWAQDELEPFRALSKAGLADVVMTGHLAHSKLGRPGEPATLSRGIINDILRADIGFRGVVMTDDLDMQAIRSRHSLDDAIVRAIAAGNDLVLVSNSLEPDPDLARRAVAAVGKALQDGRIQAGLIERASERVMSLSR